MTKKSKKNFTTEHYKDKFSWLDKRGIGGSSAATILGLNHWASPIELWADIRKCITFEKLSKEDIQRQQNDNEATVRGTMNEPLIRKMFALDFKDRYKVIEPKCFTMYRMKDKPYITATLDGLLIDKTTGKKGVLEIKTHDSYTEKDYQEYWSNKLPDNYYCQILHYLLVRNDCDFAILVAKIRHMKYNPDRAKDEPKDVFEDIKSQEIKYYYIDRNDKQVQRDIAYLEKKETEFYEKHINGNEIPELYLTL